MKNEQQKRELVLDAIADFVGTGVAGKSISLEMEASRAESDPRPKIAHEWARLRNLLVSGYATRDQARAELDRLFPR